MRLAEIMAALSVVAGTALLGWTAAGAWGSLVGAGVGLGLVIYVGRR